MAVQQKVFLGALAIVSLFIFIFQLGRLPLYDYDEAHYAQVVRQTLQSGDFLTLKRAGGEWFEKPPLILWLTMGSVKIFGENEFAIRFPAAIFSLLAIWGAYFLTFLLTNNFWAALCAGFLLLFSGIFPASGRQLRMDAPLTSAIIWAVYSFVRGWKEPKMYLWFWFWVAVGVMIKSAPALFACPITLIFSGVYKHWDWIKNKYFWLGIPLFFAVAAPWHIYETVKFGLRFWNDYFGYHIFRRATQEILGGHATTWDYLKHFLLLNEPWFILVFIITALLFFYRVDKNAAYRLSVASFLSGIFIFFVFSAAKTKLIFYLVPVLAFEAVAVAAGAFFLFTAVAWRRKQAVFTAVFSIAFFIAITSTLLQLFYFRAPYAYPHADDEREIGKIIKSYDNGHALYSFDWKAYETIYFYSGKNEIKLVDKEDLKNGFQPPYFIIMPRLYLRNENQPGLAVRYKGRYLVLLEAGQSKNK